MKLFDIIYLFEGKEEFILKQTGDKLLDAYKKDKGAGKGKAESASDVLDILVKIDKKNLQWVVNQYLKNAFSLEDVAMVKKDIAEFNKYKAKLEIKDLSRYSIGELRKALQSIAGEDVRSNKQVNKDSRQKLFDDGDAEVFYKSSTMTIVIPKTEEASCELGKGTKWCTAAKENNMFSEYSKKNPLYIIYPKNEKPYQFFFSVNDNHQMMDDLDEEVNIIEMVKKYPELTKAFSKLADKYGLYWIKNSEKNQIMAVKQNPDNIKNMEKPSEAAQLIIVNDRGDLLKYIKDPSEAVQLAAVNNDAFSIEYIKNPSEAVQLAAVTRHGIAILHIKSPSEAVQIAAVKQDGNALQYISKQSAKVQLVAVTKRGLSIRHITKPSVKIQLAAIKNIKGAIRNIKNPSPEALALAEIT